MAKYLVETYYTCSIKVSHYLDNINESELSKLEKRDDGKFEILDIKLDNRKTKNLNAKINKDNIEGNNIEMIPEKSQPKIDTQENNQKFINKIINSFLCICHSSIKNKICMGVKT